MEAKIQPQLLVTDIDNTLFDWVQYYTVGFSALLEKLSKLIQVSVKDLEAECSRIFAEEGSIEFPFVVQQLPMVIETYGDNIDRMLTECVHPCRDTFLEASKGLLKPYEGVRSTLKTIRSNYPDLPIVALTDAPRYVAMWKLNKLGLLDSFTAIYGLDDPRIPVCDKTGQPKVDSEILRKHLGRSNFSFQGQIRILPDEYEKPGIRGFKTVLMDHEEDSGDLKTATLWIGDNLKKDIGLGNRLGIASAWAKYGAQISPESLATLNRFSPPENIARHAAISPDSAESPKPDYVLEGFSDILEPLGLR